jgi:hypothetical protein
MKWIKFSQQIPEERGNYLIITTRLRIYTKRLNKSFKNNLCNKEYDAIAWAKIELPELTWLIS